MEICRMMNSCNLTNNKVQIINKMIKIIKINKFRIRTLINSHNKFN